ncbi:unnamed protein product [Bursaphelenchus okinawaensis]|uniref:Uncharacterized protein n=1 Tax=Bursaphelenchus okinawaensis TaxID=465554 RepID=A0A811JTN6_9BILA|nr:unnamed protein product [Bursaphelenchus okinawaensis]CAG9082678.1 unnamed protein product [Bursaphelenchus okinawaensis]
MGRRKQTRPKKCDFSSIITYKQAIEAYNKLLLQLEHGHQEERYAPDMSLNLSFYCKLCQEVNVSSIKAHMELHHALDSSTKWLPYISLL